MPTAHALLLENVHESASDRLIEAGCAVERRPGALAAEELNAALARLKAGGPGEILLGIRSKTRVGAAILAANPSLLAVGAFCIGTDQVALEAATRAGVAVFNAPFSSTRSVAELVIGEVIALARQLTVRDAAAHRGQWLKSAAGSFEIRGKTLAIVGYGHIGSQVGILGEAMGMRVVYFDVAPKLPLGNARRCATLGEALAQADFCTLHVPRSDATRGLIGAAELAALPKGAYLLNLSRGDVVDLDALAAAIRAGALAGAAVDVYPDEPEQAGARFSCPLQGLDNVILTPHVGGSTQEAQAAIGREVAEALAGLLARGSTAGSVTLPELDPGPITRGATRIWSVHRNEPGVLSGLTDLVARTGLNIVAQRLATNELVGVATIDVQAPVAQVAPLAAAIGGLDPSIKTRILG